MVEWRLLRSDWRITQSKIGNRTSPIEMRPARIATLLGKEQSALASA